MADELSFGEKIRQRLRKKQEDRAEKMFKMDPLYNPTDGNKKPSAAGAKKKRRLRLEDIEED